MGSNANDAGNILVEKDHKVWSEVSTCVIILCQEGPLQGSEVLTWLGLVGLGSEFGANLVLS